MHDSKVGRRLAERPAADLVKYVYGDKVKDELDANFGHMGLVNKAHVTMLCKTQIIERSVARELLVALEQIDSRGAEALELDPEREDLYYNYEHAVISLTGKNIGGQMHTARSRNDLGSTIMRMRFRQVLIALIEALCELRGSLLELAAEHTDTVMPGYTHLQPAQPISLGHYFTAVEQALQRDCERLVGALGRANHSPLGAAALAGTGYPIDRRLVCEYLGFCGLVTNTLDAVASRDYLLEALGAGAILGTTLSRFAQDLYVWYSDEFGLIGFRDQVAGTSSIMPQKKNPVVLETIRGRTALVLGSFCTAISSLRNTNYTNIIDPKEGFRTADQALSELASSCQLARLAVSNILVRKDVALNRARDNFSTVTDLADLLVATLGISFRESHEVVGAVVRKAIEKALRASDITAEMVSEALDEVLGLTRKIDEAQVKQALDPRSNVERRNHDGGPAAEEVKRMIRHAHAILKRDRELLVEAVRRIQAGKHRLESDAESIRTQ